MLINPTFATPPTMDPGIAAILSIISGDAKPPQKLADGVYEIGHFNGDHEVDLGWWVGPHGRDFDACYPLLGKITTFNEGKSAFGSFGCYGVCDSYEQVLEQCPELVSDRKRGFFIFLTKLRKDEQSPEGGWRWHKWGAYIGVQEPQCEYLYDEPVIEQVYTFHIYEVLNKDSLSEAGAAV